LSISDRVRTGAFVAALALFALLLTGGLHESLRTSGGLPGLGGDYLAYVDGLLERGETDAALDQLRLAVEIDIEDAGYVALLMAQLAQRLENRDAAVYALRRLTQVRREDADVSNALASALLASGDADASALEEAGEHSRLALRLRPGSALASFNLGSVAYARGQRDEASTWWAQAERLDPKEAETFRREARSRHPGLEAFPGPETPREPTP
jgi:tetratricopeptide (TPR) repeat protein